MKKSYFLLHISIFLAGFTGVFGKLISLNEGLLTWYRVLFASICLYLFLYLSKTPLLGDNKQKLKIASVGLLLTLHWVLFYGSIKYSNISVGVVCYALTSCFTAIWVPIIKKKKLDSTELALSFITVAGIALIFHFDASHRTGIVLGVISSAIAALYTVLNKDLVGKFDTKVLNFYQLLGGTIVLGLLLPVYLHFFPSSTFLPSLSDTIYLLILAVVCTVGLYILFAEALKLLPAFTVSLSFNLEPIYAIFIAFLFFGEAQEVNRSFYWGVGSVIVSVVLQSLISYYKIKQLSPKR